MSDVANLDPVLLCPYNTSHQILKSRMQYHLVKCSKSYPDVERETCPFNATHRIPRPELQFHIQACPDKRVVESHKYQAEDEVAFGGPTAYQEPTLPPNDEDWDMMDCNSYQPSSSVSNKVMLRNLAGATKSERKQFRMQERRRVANLDDSNDDEPTEPQTEPLRLPKTSSHTQIKGTKLGMGRGGPANGSTDFPDICFGRGRGYFKKS